MTTLTSLTELLSSRIDADWVALAACGDLPISALDAFFVEAGGRLERTYARLCATCSVQSECLNHAVAGGLAAGYFGGTSPTARRKLETSVGVVPVAASGTR